MISNRRCVLSSSLARRCDRSRSAAAASEPARAAQSSATAASAATRSASARSAAIVAAITSAALFRVVEVPLLAGVASALAPPSGGGDWGLAATEDGETEIATPGEDTPLIPMSVGGALVAAAAVLFASLVLAFVAVGTIPSNAMPLVPMMASEGEVVAAKGSASSMITSAAAASTALSSAAVGSSDCAVGEMAATDPPPPRWTSDGTALSPSSSVASFLVNLSSFSAAPAPSSTSARF